MQSQPVFEKEALTVDMDLLRQCLDVCEDAIENATECMQTHDTNLGRTTRKNKHIGDMYERDVANARRLRDKLRAALGYPKID